MCRIGRITVYRSHGLFQSYLRTCILSNCTGRDVKYIRFGFFSMLFSEHDDRLWSGVPEFSVLGAVGGLEFSLLSRMRA